MLLRSLTPSPPHLIEACKLYCYFLSNESAFNCRFHNIYRNILRLRINGESHHRLQDDRTWWYSIYLFIIVNKSRLKKKKKRPKPTTSLNTFPPRCLWLYNLRESNKAISWGLFFSGGLIHVWCSGEYFWTLYS